MNPYWYTLLNEHQQDTPALLLYKNRIEENIDRMLGIVGNPNRLRPHIKTHKTAEIIQLMMDRGIKKFKCATIAEAELLGMLEVPDVLLAYQPFGPKIDRLVQLQKKYPHSRYSTILDNWNSAVEIAQKFEQAENEIEIFIDVNVGMNRTGILPNKEAAHLFLKCEELKGIRVLGFHVYDGHIRDADIEERILKCNNSLEPVFELGEKLEKKLNMRLEYVVGGTPTFPVHAKNERIDVSPGTCVLWDAGYDKILPDQDFLFGALVITRVISKLSNNQICLDLGHKSIAAENPFPRLKFLNLQDVVEIGQSEEHLVVSIPDSTMINIGDVIYAVPIHICPTCTLRTRGGC